MIFRKHYTGTVHVYSGSRRVDVISNGHRLWPRYLADEAAGKLGPAIPAPVVPERTLEQARAEKISAAQARTRELFAAGVTASVDGVEYLFDVGGGERSLSSWLGYGGLATDALAGIIPTAAMQPAITKSGETLAITPAAGKALYLELLGKYRAITGPESAILKAVAEATTIAEIDALEDPR